VRLYNPNRSNLTFKSGSLDIFVDDRKLGHTELDSTIYIPRLDTFSIPLVVKLDISNVIGNALSMGLKDSVLVRLTGKIKVGRSGVFITRPVNYEQKEKLDLF
jgi:LEA14-like dessication related protein